MMLRRVLFAAAALAVLALTPPAAKTEPTRIAYLSRSFDISDAWERVFWSMQGRPEEVGVEFEAQSLAVDSYVDHAGPLAQVESVLAAGVDYVFLGPTEFEAAIPALCKLKQSAVPTVVYNFATPHEDESARAMSYIAFAHYPGGVKSAEWTAEYLKGEGKVLILRGAPGVISDDPGGGFLSIVEQQPDIEVVMCPYTDFDRAKAYDAAQNMPAAHPDINLIYGISTAISLGAAQVVRQMGKSEEIATMGFGGTRDEIVAMAEGWLTASVLRPIDYSGVAVADAFVAHSKGEEVPLVWAGPFITVDRWSDAEEIVENANRYSRPKMGR